MTSSPKKKSGIWFIVLPILIIGVLIYTKNFSFSITSDTQFTPEELLSIMDNYSLNHIAGECTDKGFILFEQNEDRENYHRYNYFFVGKNPSHTQKNDRDRAGDDMKERVTIIPDKLSGFYYTIKDKDRYLKFMNALVNEHNAQPYNDLKHPYFSETNNYYVFRSTVIIDNAFDVKYNGWSLYFTTKQELERFAQQHINDSLLIIKQHDDSLAIAKQIADSLTAYAVDSSVAYIAINIAEVYEKYNSYSGFTTIPKGTGLKVIRRANYRLFCDFITSEGNPYSGWVSEGDIVYKPVKSSNEIDAQVAPASDNRNNYYQ